MDEIIIDGKDIESIVVEDEYGARIATPAITNDYVHDALWIDANSTYKLSEVKIKIRLKKDGLQVKPL